MEQSDTIRLAGQLIHASTYIRRIIIIINSNVRPEYAGGVGVGLL
jgi:hypothetical protein